MLTFTHMYMHTHTHSLSLALTHTHTRTHTLLHTHRKHSRTNNHTHTHKHTPIHTDVPLAHTSVGRDDLKTTLHSDLANSLKIDGSRLTIEFASVGSESVLLSVFPDNTSHGTYMFSEETPVIMRVCECRI